MIIPTMRRPLRLARALASVAAQTYPQVEVVVVNDGGMPVEAVIERARREGGRPITYLALAANMGPSVARSRAIAVASGELIALLDDDDRFRPGHLARLVGALTADPGAALAYDDALIQVEEGTAADGEPRVVAECRFGLPYDEAKFDIDDYIVTSAALFRREAYEAAGGFDATLPFLEDWDLWLRLRQRGRLVYAPGEIGVDYSLRAEAGDNLGSTFDARRRAALDLLSARYGLPRLEPKTFLDVARGLGFAVRPVAVSRR
ncbi:MAG: hypothetical protein OJF49_001176 [Ktedonobacterales bacterium]|nr:MAG: hypothetical protein OJF49_001176 [Ktedonobacterales bacterium]